MAVHNSDHLCISICASPIFALHWLFDIIFIITTGCWFVRMVTVDLVQYLPENSNRGYQALLTANDIVNMVVIDDQTTYQKYVIKQTLFPA